MKLSGFVRFILVIVALVIIGYGIYYTQTQNKNEEADGENSGSNGSEETLGGNAGVIQKESNHFPVKSGLGLNPDKPNQNFSNSTKTTIQGDITTVPPQQLKKPDVHNISDDNRQRIIEYIKHTNTTTDYSQAIYITEFSKNQHEYKQRIISMIENDPLSQIAGMGKAAIDTLRFYAIPDSNHKKEILKNFVCEVIKALNTHAISHVTPEIKWIKYSIINYLTLLSMYECLIECQSKTLHKSDSICHDAIIKLVPQWNYFLGQQLTGIEYLQVNVPRLLTNYLYDHQKFVDEQTLHDSEINRVFESNSPTDYNYYNYFKSVYDALTNHQTGTVLPERPKILNVNNPNPSDDVNMGRSEIQYSPDRRNQSLPDGSAKIPIQTGEPTVLPQEQAEHKINQQNFNISEKNRAFIMSKMVNHLNKTDYSKTPTINAFSRDPTAYMSSINNMVSKMEISKIFSILTTATDALRYCAKDSSSSENETLKQYVREIIIAMNNALPITNYNNQNIFSIFKKYLILLSMYECLVECDPKNYGKINSICHDAIIKLVPEWNNFLNRQLTGMEFVTVNVSRLLTNYLYDHQKFVEEHTLHYSEILQVITSTTTADDDLHDYFDYVYYALSVSK